MHDARALLNGKAVAGLARRGHVLDTTLLAKLVERRSDLVRERDALRADLNRRARSGAGNNRPENADRDHSRDLREHLRTVTDEHRGCETALRDFLLAIPNVPSDEAPDGGPMDPPVEIRRWGHRPMFEFTPRDHADLGAALGILDPVRAVKLSGARFAVTRGSGARLERALAAFLLDLHTQEHGYVEHGLPHLVSTETMTGTGQLPKFAEDLLATKVAGRDLLMIPTAEVPLVNLYRDELIDESALPLALTAHTPCYRGEAGSYGRDTRGLIRLHQFEKVELVRICDPECADAELRLLLSHAEVCLQRLGLHYRVVELRTGDLGFAARRTYDIEVWLPSQGTFREISSCSDCGTFQARRANIRMKGQGGRKTFPVTLNGSGLPIGRTMAALIEQYQRADGSVTIPPVLAPYTGFPAISQRGGTT